ncbi:MAG: DUF308 domain-containing protein [Anaerolineaceae bacterium]|nr:DUF308 domain-containing protein [Anaerolineaceae bacterium]
MNFKKLMGYLTIVVFIFFEVYAGVRLLTNPVDFTNSVVFFFGIIMLIIGVISVIRAFQAKSTGMLPYRLSLFGGILDIIIGIACVFLTDKVVGLFPVLLMVYGIFMVVAGIHKIRNYLVLKDFGVHNSWLVVVSAVLSIILGIIVFLNPFTAAATGWTVTGIFLIAEGVCDLFAFIFSFFL